MTLLDAYSRLMSILEEGGPAGDGPCDYCDLCARIGVVPAELDDLLLRELGMRGDELVQTYRSIGGKKPDTED